MLAGQGTRDEGRTFLKRVIPSIQDCGECASFGGARAAPSFFFLHGRLASVTSFPAEEEEEERKEEKWAAEWAKMHRIVK